MYTRTLLSNVSLTALLAAAAAIVSRTLSADGGPYLLNNQPPASPEVSGLTLVLLALWISVLAGLAMVEDPRQHSSGID